MRNRFLPLFLMVAISTGCRPTASTQSHDEFPRSAITQFTAKSELFAEHPFLVVGQDSSFVAHVTDLKDFSPVKEGKMEAILVASDGSKEVFSVEGLERAGIFRPVIKPKAPGQYRLLFQVTSPKLVDQIDAGNVLVYADKEAARAASPQEEHLDTISFLKEQQWKLPYESQIVRKGILEDGIALQGSVTPVNGREAIIGAPTSGRIALNRYPRLGNRVRAGETLAVLTPVSREARSELTQAMTSAEALLRQAKLEHSRVQRLFAAQAVPGKRVEEARTEVEIREAAFVSARKRLDAKTASLNGQTGLPEESYRVTAPFSGTIVEASLVPGGTVEEGRLLYRLVDLSQVWIEARAHENDLNRLLNAQKAEISVSGVENAKGTLVTIGSMLDPNSRTAPVVYSVPNPRGIFRIGMTAKVRALTGQSKPLPVIPKSAVVDDNNRPIVYVQAGGESFERRELTLGVRQGDQVQVLSGLKPGERVVTKGGYEIRLSTLSNSIPAHGHAH